jgi:tRNA pseudouridine38-40 synthase
LRYKLTIEYDGSLFSGWQIQPDARTVEGELEEALQTVLQHEADIVGQGRTDTGVHAVNQVAHVDLPDDADPDKIRLSLNRLTGDDVYVKSIEKVSGDFHARFDALSRSYVYTFIREPWPLQRAYAAVLARDCDLSVMKSAAALFLGEHDFAAFSKKNEDNFTTLCTVSRSEILEFGDRIEYHITANRFLRNMVRRIAGTLMDAGSGNISEEEIRDKLQSAEADSAGSKTAPARGLKLLDVKYD